MTKTGVNIPINEPSNAQAPQKTRGSKRRRESGEITKANLKIGNGCTYAVFAEEKAAQAYIDKAFAVDEQGYNVYKSSGILLSLYHTKTRKKTEYRVYAEPTKEVGSWQKAGRIWKKILSNENDEPLNRKQAKPLSAKTDSNIPATPSEKKETTTRPALANSNQQISALMRKLPAPAPTPSRTTLSIMPTTTANFNPVSRPTSPSEEGAHTPFGFFDQMDKLGQENTREEDASSMALYFPKW